MSEEAIDKIDVEASLPIEEKKENNVFIEKLNNSEVNGAEPSSAVVASVDCKAKDENPVENEKIEKKIEPEKTKSKKIPNNPANRPTLRPRKKETPPDSPPTKRSKKNSDNGSTKEKISAEPNPQEKKAPDLKVPDAIQAPPEAGNGPAEMPQLQAEAPTSRRRKKNRPGPKKRNSAAIEERKERTVPSPSLAECNVNPACPESSATATEATRPPLCLCGKKPHVFVSSNNNPGDLTCQALDSLDGRIIGCCNPLPTTTVGLHRSSSRTPYIMLCAVHLQRLLRHNCCPGCGLFCTQGKYLSCIGLHHYHKACARHEGCLHCGDLNPPKTITITLKSRRDFAFLPRPRPFRSTKPAKMSVGRDAAPKDEPLPVKLPPEVEKWTAESSNSSALPRAQESQNLVDSEKLAQLIDVATAALSVPRPVLSNSNRYSYKSLLTAAKIGDHLKLLKLMSVGINPSHVFVEMKNQTALHIAAYNGHVILVHLLLQAGLPIDLLDSDQNTPLSLAVLSSRHEVVKYLVKAGASLIIKGEDGMSPLHLAAMNGNIEACTHLLSSPSLPRRYVDSLDDGGWTPLVWGCEFNHIHVVRLLLREGADPLIHDVEQNIALHWAAYGGCIDVVELLLSRGCQISAVNAQGDTPLHIAARQDKYDCVVLLLARGARSDIKNRIGHTPRDCTSIDSPIYKAINLNMELSQLIERFNQRGPRVLCNDITRGKERNPIQCVNAVDDEPEPKDFVYVKDSCFTTRISVDRTITSLQSCTCKDNCTSGACTCTSISMRAWYDCDGKLSPEFSYHDPPMIFECNQACGCNRITCQNRVVQNELTCRFQLFRTDSRGWGVKSLNFIAKGSFVCEYIGEIITDSEADHREDDSYLFDLDNKDGETYCIDARRYGNIARFINHKCTPNVIPVHVFVEQHDMRFPRIAFFANQDIQPDEELGYNYGEKFWIIKYKTFTCTCKSEKCMYSKETIKATLDQYRKKLHDFELMEG